MLVIRWRFRQGTDHLYAREASHFFPSFSLFLRRSAIELRHVNALSLALTEETGTTRRSSTLSAESYSTRSHSESFHLLSWDPSSTV